MSSLEEVLAQNKSWQKNATCFNLVLVKLVGTFSLFVDKALFDICYSDYLL